jgi:tRNA-5-taurinomethyluridine 2-sulfurtransferase
MKVAVLVSGGVDSSVALALLKQQGHDVTAFYLKIWLEDEVAYLGECPWEEDLSFARATCQKVGVPLKVRSLQTEYWDHVVTYTLREIREGKTPNPDMFCNTLIKFGFFLQTIDASYEKVATGHYAQVEEQDGVFYLKKSPDAVKDQTYFLAGLTQGQLKRALFPIGHLTKPHVRELAHEFDLPTKDRKDSQGICFLGKIKFTDFVRHHLGERIGNIVDLESGTILGEHKGFWFYTIGQRQGIGLSGGPWYVAAKDVLTNTIYVSRAYYDEDKERNSFYLAYPHWISGVRPEKNALQVKIRHGAAFHECVLSWKDDTCVVTLATRDQGLAPGQFAVFYDGDYCLGAGSIMTP